MSKLPNISTNIFSTMSALANEYKAINLAQGFPDFPVSKKLIDDVTLAMQQGYNQYAPMIGMPELRNALAQKIDKLYQNKINADTEITITPGGTYSIYTSLTAILQPNDEVIILEPAYDCYLPTIEMQGAKAISVPLQFPTFQINWQLVKESISEKTKAIVINTPHNPTGFVWTKEDMKQLEQITEGTNIYIISDEVYEHITFDGREHESILKYPNLYNRSFVTFSFGKVFHATGWKMGYCVAPENLMKEFRKIHQFICFTTNSPMQIGLAKFLENEHEYLSLSHFYEQKRNLFLEAIKDIPFTIYEKTQGSYFQMASYENISNLNDKDFACWLTKEIGVAVIPVSAFYSNAKDDKLVRFCFAKKDETLLQACEKMRKLV